MVRQTLPRLYGSLVVTDKLEVFGALVRRRQVLLFGLGLFLAEKARPGRPSESSGKKTGGVSRAAQGATKAAR